MNFDNIRTNVIYGVDNEQCVINNLINVLLASDASGLFCDIVGMSDVSKQ